MRGFSQYTTEEYVSFNLFEIHQCFDFETNQLLFPIISTMYECTKNHRARRCAGVMVDGPIRK